MKRKEEKYSLKVSRDEETGFWKTAVLEEGKQVQASYAQDEEDKERDIRTYKRIFKIE